MTQTATPHTTLVVLDGNAPWVQSLFRAMPEGVAVQWLKPVQPWAAVRRPRLLVDWGWRLVGSAAERTFVYPGWTRFPKWSARVCAGAVRAAARGVGGRVVVVYTLPFYGSVAAKVNELPSVYFAYDPYGSYDGWDAAKVEVGERQLFAHCRAAFAVAPALADDFRGLTDRPVFVQPNGLPEAALVDTPRPPRPVDLPIGGPVVVCIGQIGSAYDWPLLDEVTHRLPRVNFVFVGPRHSMPADATVIADRVFARPNVTTLGFRDPAVLGGYCSHADVLVSPLAVTPATDRRSLLRMYDYLATDRPVLATPVASAKEHSRFCRLVDGPESFARELLTAVTDGCTSAEVVARREYLAAHTWPRRAELFLRNLTHVIPDLPSHTS